MTTPVGGRVQGLIPLAVATGVGSAGLAAGGTAGALVVADITGTSGAAGLPVTALLVGSAAAALLISRLAAHGRRGLGIALGYGIGVVGAVTVVVATVLRSVPLLLGGSVVLGAANSSVFLTRYAAADLGPRSSQGRALGVVLLATAGGAVCGPLLLGPSGTLARAVGLPELAGLYLVAVVAFGVSAAVFAAAANPRTPWLGGAASVLRQADRRDDGPAFAMLRSRATAPAFAVLAAANFIMVGTMAVAPVHLVLHGQTVRAVGIIVGLHVAGMFGPAPVAGRLADRSGPTTVLLLGNVLLLLASVAGVLFDQQNPATAAATLVLLGVGWSFGVVGGSALLVGRAAREARAHVEGAGEVAMGIAAAIAAPLAGLVLATRGYGAVSLAGGLVALVALVFITRSQPWRSRHETAHL